MRVYYTTELKFKCGKPMIMIVLGSIPKPKTLEEEEKVENTFKKELTANGGGEHLKKIHPCGTNGCLTATLWKKEDIGKKIKVCQLYPEPN